jgi:mannose-6-phosphate isomerase-like protein (cupin superfamily)
MIEKARNERKPDQPNFIQPILQADPYNVNLEYRVQGIDTNPNIHDVEAEIVYVVDGAGVLTIGGKLKDERRTNDKNRTGSKLEGGMARRIAKGDYILIPENTAHSFTQVEGRLVIMSVHVPRGGPAN